MKLSNSWIDLDLAGVLLLRFGGKFGVLSGRRCRFSLFWLVEVLRLLPIDGINGLLFIKLISSGSKRWILKNTFPLYGKVSSLQKKNLWKNRETWGPLARIWLVFKNWLAPNFNNSLDWQKKNWNKIILFPVDRMLLEWRFPP